MDRTENTPDPQIRRVTLPSGKSIEVLYFAEAEGDAVTAAPTEAPMVETTETRTPLHVCEHCSSSLVYPTEWDEAGPDHWRVELRCPNCEWYGEGVFDQDTVEAFDDVLDQGIDVLLSDYRALVNSNMEDEIDRFAAALDADAILPSDF
jgi:hypothetical protein